MTFVTPLLLAGTAMIAIPIILHLIMRRKPVLMEFPALRFVKKRHDQNQRSLKLRHLLLLILRAAVIAFLAIALARPSVQFGGSLGSQEAPVAAAMVFDTAPHIAFRHENQTRLDVAKKFGEWLLLQLPSESQIAVLDTRFGRGDFQIDRSAARQRIDRLEVVPNSQPLTGALEEGLRLLKENPLGRKELYLFTDLSRGSWPTNRAAQLREKLAELGGVGIYVIDVGVKEPTDVALGEVRLSGEILPNRSALTIGTDLSTLGITGERVVELFLVDAEGKSKNRGSQNVAPIPGESQPIEFRLESLELGTHQGYLRIVGQDGLASDDTRYFSVEVKPAWKVLLAAPQPAESYAVFLAEALAPSVYRQRGQARFDCDIVSLDQLPKKNLADYSAVFLLDPSPLEPASWKMLSEYASEGHGVGIFLGRNAMPFDKFNIAEAQQILPGALLRQAVRSDGSLHLAPKNLQHPILLPFQSKSGEVPWDGFPVLRYWELGKIQPGVGVVVPMSDGRPAVLERPIGLGRSLTMTTPISDRPQKKPWNLLPVGEAWPFFILANQMASYLVGSTSERLNYYAGQTAMLELDAREDRTSFLLSAPSGDSFPVQADRQRHRVMISSTDQVGNYRLRAGAEGNRFDRGFSVNLTPEQTQLDRISESDLKEMFAPHKFNLARTKEQIDRNLSLGRVGRELFPLTIVFVALLLILELFVSNRFYKDSILKKND